ncbi:unnamed protein product [Prunus brigantina]
MCLGNESSNWGTNSQPARIADTVKACTPEIPVLRAQTTTPQGPRQHPVKDAPYIRIPPLKNLKSDFSCGIDPNLPNSQLELRKRGRTLTCFTGNGGARRRKPPI